MGIVSIFILLLGVMACLMLFSKKGFAHGYVESPPSRAFFYSTRNNNGSEAMVGSAAWQPQSLGRHQNNGWPHTPQSPPDGQLASAGCLHGCPQIDIQNATRWHKTNISPGWNEFTWFYTAWHATASWQFFITRQGWDQNAPLTRASFDLNPIYSEPYRGENPGSNGRTRHRVWIPEDRSGYHVVYAVWTTTPGQNNETFYNVIDVNIVNGGVVTPPPVTPPPAPEPEIPLPPVVTPPPVTPPPVTPPPVYPEGPSGNVVAPTNLRITDQTASSISIGWTSNNDPSSTTYEIFRNGVRVAEVPGGTYAFTDYAVTSGATNTYTVRARAIAFSAHSNQAVGQALTQPPAVTPPPPPVVPPGVRVWNANDFFNAGDIVSYQGRLYRALVTFNGHGVQDWNPAAALTLWAPV